MLSEREIVKYIGAKTIIEDQVDLTRVSAAKNFFNISDLSLEDGKPLPKYWHWFFCWDTATKELLGGDGHIKPGNNIIPDTGFPRRMWGGGEVSFYSPLRLGMHISREITIEDIKYKNGTSGNFSIVQVRNDYKNDENVLVSEKQNLIYLPNREKFTELQKKKLEEVPTFSRKEAFTSQQLFQYSALTMNSHRIHYDMEYCKTVEFYPDIVVHGPLLAQNLISLADEKLEGKLSKFQFTAISPVFLKEHFSINLKEKDKCLELWINNQSGKLSMKAKAT